MNEELQSTIEELETTNEELQSTNEELETMNEELQSTNEEIETVNEELRLRGEERDKLNGFLQSILGSLKSGVIVVDRDLHVQVWNARSEDLWGLRMEEVRDKNLLGLDIGLPLDRIKPAHPGLPGRRAAPDLRPDRRHHPSGQADPLPRHLRPDAQPRRDDRRGDPGRGGRQTAWFLYNKRKGRALEPAPDDLGPIHGMRLSLPTKRR